VDDRTTHGTFTLCVDNVSGIEYWAIASGNWNVASNWSRSEGGPPASAKPGTANVVHIKGYAITVTGTETCAEIDMPVANNNTSLVVDAGSLTVNGVMNVTNSGTNYSGDVQVINGGTLNIIQDLTFSRNGGNAALALTVSGSSSVSSGQDLTFRSSTGTTADNSITLGNSATLTVTRDLSLINTGGPKTTMTLNNTAVLNAVRDIYFTASAQDKVEIQMNDNTILNLSGNMRRGSPAYGKFASNGSATLVFKGSSYLQTWPVNTGAGTDAFSYQQVVINNTKVTTPQVSLDGPVTVNGSVAFTKGVVGTTATNILIIPAGASVSGASSESFVDGPVRKTGNTAFTFPIGNSGNYKPISISAPSVATDAFSARYYYANPHPTYNNTLRVPALTNISECEYWTMTRDAGSSNIQATIGWDSLSCCVGSLTDLKVAVWEGSLWTDHGNGGTTGTVSAGTVVTSAALSQNSNILSFANTLPEVSFSGLASPYCESAAAVLLTGSPAGATGLYTGTGITDNGDGTATFDPAAAGAGSFTIVYTYTDPVSGCSNDQSQTVTVYANPKASMHQSATVCAGSLADLNIFFTGRAPWNFTYTDGTNTHSGTTSSNPYALQSAVAGTYQVTALTDANGCTGSDFGSPATISNYPPLSTPEIDTIGPVVFCEGSSVTLYTAPAGSFAVWSNGISAYSQVITEAGSYSVKIVDSHGCVSPESPTTSITVNKVPRKPFSITGNTSVCQNGPATALSTNAAYATTYNWQVAPSSAGTFSGNTSAVNLTWDPPFSGVATIRVSGSNVLCGEGPLSDPLVITVDALPSDPGSITGPDSVCRSTDGIVYSISPVADATSYSWSLPAGTLIDGPSTGNSITVDFGPAAADGNITVSAVNGCGNSFNTSSLAVNVFERPVPSLIGNTTVNLNDTEVYTTDDGMSAYSWAVSAGGLIIAGGGASDDSITIQWTAGGAQWVSVNYTNANQCAALTPVILPVMVNLLPGKPATPAGLTQMCSGSPDTPYTTAGATGAVTYIWSISPSAAGSISGIGLTGTVSWDPAWYGLASITVTGHNAGGDGPASDPISVTVFKRPTTGPVYFISNGTFN
jgi:hypothetical protein